MKYDIMANQIMVTNRIYVPCKCMFHLYTLSENIHSPHLLCQCLGKCKHLEGQQHHGVKGISIMIKIKFITAFFGNATTLICTADIII